jgi:signal peptidase I
VTIEDADTGASASLEAPTSDKRSRPHIPIWQETLILLVIAVVLAVVLKAFFVQAFYIPSESMEPGLVKNDRILVQKVSYWAGGSPSRGDVVVFEDPGGWLSAADEKGPDNPVAKLLAKIGLMPTGGHLVKRVVGVAGDTIVCCDSKGNISVNGVAIDEKGYVKDDSKSPCNGPMTGTCDWTAGPVPPGDIFVMGDNRLHSADSSQKLCPEAVTDCVEGREFVPVDLVVGKVFALVWPLGHFGGVGTADSFAKVPDAK